MTSLEQAVKDALANDWEPRAVRNEFSFVSRGGAWVDVVSDYHVLLDPAFWQALGKARRWDEHRCIVNNGLCDKCWSSHWHRLIDHLASGKEVESFFATL